MIRISPSLRRTGPALVDKAGEILYRHYRMPVFNLIRREFPRIDPHRAEDLSQDVFLTLWHGGFARARREKGSFRGLLYTTTRRTVIQYIRRLYADKHGGRSTHSSFDAVEHLAADTGDAEVVFVRDWIRCLIDAAQQHIAHTLESRRDAEFYAALLSEHPDVLYEVRIENGGYEKLMQRFGLTDVTLRKRIFDLRKRFKALVQLEISRYASTPEELQEEVDFLMRVLEQSSEGLRPTG